MIFPIGETWTMTLPAAQGTVSALVGKWNDFMAREASAISEFQALQADDRGRELETMRERMRTDLPHVIPSDIIDEGLLLGSSDPYRVYVEKESTDWIHQAVDATLSSDKEKYANMLRGLLKDRQKQAHLGKYFFELQTFDLTIDSFGAQSFDVHLKVDIEAKVNLDIDHTTVNIDTDTVGLKEVADDIKRAYLDMLRGELIKDIEGEYNRLSGIFNAFEDVAIKDLGGVLH